MILSTCFSCRLLAVLRGFCCLFLLSAFASSQVPVEPATIKSLNSSGTADQPRDIQVRAGDLLEVSVFGVPEFKQELRVSEDGKVNLPFLGPIIVAGRSTSQIQETVASGLSKGGFFREPQVTVLLKDFIAHGITVVGEVEHPGVYPVITTKRLFDLISMSGGFTPKAGQSISVTHADRPQQPVTVNLTKDSARSFDSNVEIFPGDTILVSKAGIVYVVGDVVRPGGYTMENGERMTLLQAIAMAQGINRTAAIGSAKLIRRIEGKPNEVPITLKGILSAKAADIELQPEDILFVPGSLAKNAFKRGLDSALQIATSVAIYGAH